MYFFFSVFLWLYGRTKEIWTVKKLLTSQPWFLSTKGSEANTASDQCEPTKQNTPRTIASHIYPWKYFWFNCMPARLAREKRITWKITPLLFGENSKIYNRRWWESTVATWRPANTEASTKLSSSGLSLSELCSQLSMKMKWLYHWTP